jgi:hypothetical protein
MTSEATKNTETVDEELVTVAKPGEEKDVTYLSEAGPIRFSEGKAYGVSLSVARKLADGRPGWTIEPVPRLTRRKA